jgi:hypothetical protein
MKIPRNTGRITLVVVGVMFLVFGSPTTFT